MSYGYKAVTSNIALGVLTKIPHIPDFSLMVGSAENMFPTPLLIYSGMNPVQTSPIIPSVKDQKVEDVTETLIGNTITSEQFPNEMYLGNAIDGG